MKNSGGDNSNFILTLSIVSGSVSQGATVQRGRSCQLMGQSVLQEKTVPAWTLALDTVWSRERPLKPRMDVTTGQNSHTHGKNTLHAYTTHLSFGKKGQENKYVGFPLCFSTCEGGRFNCSRYPCPGGWNQLDNQSTTHETFFYCLCSLLHLHKKCMQSIPTDNYKTILHCKVMSRVGHKCRCHIPLRVSSVRWLVWVVRVDSMLQDLWGRVCDPL